jgi:hypothetical protein
MLSIGTACSSIPFLASPTELPPPPTLALLPTFAPPVLLPPTVAPPTAVVASPTAAPPTETLPAAPTIAAITATPLQKAVTPTRSASPTLALAPGIYLTNLRTEPSPPTRNAELVYHATFVNTTGSQQTYKWVVFIYKTETPNRSFGQTTQTTSNIPVGTSEHRSLGFWRLGPGGGCDYFFARVAYFDAENRQHFFIQPDGKVFEKPFNVC